MNQHINYQKELDKLISSLERTGQVPKLFLHSCCAPCSSYLSSWFEITDFFYNPNIYPEEEYRKRESELERLIREMPLRHPVSFRAGHYDPKVFFERVRGMEDLPEGGKTALKYIYESKPENVFSFRVGEESFEKLRERARIVRKNTFDKPFKSLDMIEAMEG